jgi:hypothetical protein
LKNLKIPIIKVKSLPKPITEPPPAMRAASPPLDPPGDLVRSLGLRVTPKMGLLQSYEMFV